MLLWDASFALQLDRPAFIQQSFSAGPHFWKLPANNTTLLTHVMDGQVSDGRCYEACLMTSAIRKCAVSSRELCTNIPMAWPPFRLHALACERSMVTPSSCSPQGHKTCCTSYSPEPTETQTRKHATSSAYPSTQHLDQTNQDHSVRV
jgi:hypothetical protein